jgi:hypothetical protein
MARDPDAVLERHRQRFPHSAASSLIELMLKLMGTEAPDLQSLEPVLPQAWRSFINQRVGGVVVRRLEWEREMFRHLLSVELGSGRPVGLLLNTPASDGEPAREQAWAIIRINEVRPYLFADLVGKHPERGGGEGQFTAKRLVRMDQIADAEVAAVVYCEVARG